MPASPARPISRIAAVACLGLGLAGLSHRSDAQCQLLAAPGKFDPPASGLPTGFQGRQDSLSIGGAPGTHRLAVRYNYGFLVYSLANPGAPVRTSIEDLLGMDQYPKNGDGSERTGPVALSADGTRALQPWTDTVGYGTIAMSSSGGAFLAGGDFPPAGYAVRNVAVGKVGTRYLGFSISDVGINAADITDYLGDTGPAQANGIYSEVIHNVGVSSPAGITAVEAAGRSYVVVWDPNNVYVTDVSNPGTPSSGLTTNFTSRTYSASQLGLPSGSFLYFGVAAARHPSTGDLYLLTEGGSLSGSNVATKAVTLNRVDPLTGNLTRIGTYVPPTGANYAQGQVVLLPLDTEVVAFFLEGTNAGGLKPEVHSSTAFSVNLAAAIPAFTEPTQALALAGMRASGGNVFLYLSNRLATYVASLSCTLAPSPVTAALSAEKISYTGGAATPVLDGGTVFVGDQIRVTPTFSPGDAVERLLDWRLDYDFHDGNPLDSNGTTFRLKQPDLHVTTGGPFPTQATLIGPCDPAQVPQGGSAPVPSTGIGCWESVTTNGMWTVPGGTPDFSPSLPVDTQLTIGFEVQNALNQGSSSLATHRITWKVPRHILKNTSLLSGGGLEDISEGSPLATGFRWYFAHVPVGETGADDLKLEAGCTGDSCTPASFTQPGETNPGLQQPGRYRYWVSVPYRSGFRTAECPGLLGDQVTCSGDAAKTVLVSDVVLSLTAPAQVLAGTPSISVTSASAKSTAVAACPLATTGFSYSFCVVAGNACPEGAWFTSDLTATNPFPTSGTGTISIPTPSAGTLGLRLLYSYTTTGSCASPKTAQWPATGWSPLTVLAVPPTIRLRNISDTADIPTSLGIYWELFVGQTARPYAELNGIRDANPPAGLAWSYRPTGSSSETAIGTAQGEPFSISTTGEFELVLRGYGTEPVVARVGVSQPIGTPPIVSSVTFSKTKPAVNETVTVSCGATQGTFAIGSHVISFGDGQSTTGAASSASHAWATEGTKTVGCTAYDINGLPSATRTAQIDVGGPDVGPTVTAIVVSPAPVHPGIPTTFTCLATPPAGRLVAGYELTFGDGTSPVNGPLNEAVHVYQATGTYVAVCRAYDASGRSGQLQKVVDVYEPTYSLQVTRIGSGSGVVTSTPAAISCGSTCSGLIGGGETLTLDAVPTAGSRFAGWSGSSCLGSGPCTVLMAAARRVTANFLLEAGTAFHTLAPCRMADTRSGSGIPLAAGETREFPVTGSACDVPAATQSVALNVTVTQPAGAGFVTVFPSGAEIPGTQTAAFSPGRTRATAATIVIGNGGAVSVYNASAGSVHVILDVSGAFQ